MKCPSSVADIPVYLEFVVVKLVKPKMERKKKTQHHAMVRSLSKCRSRCFVNVYEFRLHITLARYVGMPVTIPEEYLMGQSAERNNHYDTFFQPAHPIPLFARLFERTELMKQAEKRYRIRVH